MTPDEFLDWLCWSIATTGDRFFPPEETAKECMDALYDGSEPISDAELTYRKGVEVGQHSRAWSEAIDMYEQMDARGFDPIERAERYVRQAREDGHDLPEIDWSWLEGSSLASEEEP